jgi:hypothetical protein
MKLFLSDIVNSPTLLVYQFNKGNISKAIKLLDHDRKKKSYKTTEIEINLKCQRIQ